MSKCDGYGFEGVSDVYLITVYALSERVDSTLFGEVGFMGGGCDSEA